MSANNYDILTGALNGVGMLNTGASTWTHAGGYFVRVALDCDSTCFYMTGDQFLDFYLDPGEEIGPGDVGLFRRPAAPVPKSCTFHCTGTLAIYHGASSFYVYTIGSFEYWRSYTVSPSPSPSITATPSPTMTPTPSATFTPTLSPTLSVTFTPSPTPIGDAAIMTGYDYPPFAYNFNSISMKNTGSTTWTPEEGYYAHIELNCFITCGGPPSTIDFYMDAGTQALPGETYTFRLLASPAPKSCTVGCTGEAQMRRGEVAFSSSPIEFYYFYTFTPVPTLTPSPSATPTSTPPALFFVEQPKSQTVNLGQDVEFHALAQGEPPINYAWLKDSQFIYPDEDETALAISNATTARAGVYTLGALNAFGFVVSNPATLTVLDPPAPNSAVFIGSSLPATIYAGETLYISVVFMNTSLVTWSAPQGYKLAARGDPDGLIGGADRFGFLDPHAVIPNGGGKAQFVARIDAPSEPGTYAFKVQMVEEFVEFFGPEVTLQAIIVPRPNAAGDWAAYE